MLLPTSPRVHSMPEWDSLKLASILDYPKSTMQLLSWYVFMEPYQELLSRKQWYIKRHRGKWYCLCHLKWDNLSSLWYSMVFLLWLEVSYDNHFAIIQYYWRKYFLYILCLFQMQSLLAALELLTVLVTLSTAQFLCKSVWIIQSYALPNVTLQVLAHTKLEIDGEFVLYMGMRRYISF